MVGADLQVGPYKRKVGPTSLAVLRVFCLE